MGFSAIEWKNILTPKRKFHLKLGNCFFNFNSNSIWFKGISFQFKYSTGKNFRNNLFNFIILERRQFFHQIKENISVSDITSVLCDCADIYFFERA